MRFADNNMPTRRLRRIGRNLTEGAQEAGKFVRKKVRRKVRRIPRHFVEGIKEVKEGFPNTVRRKKRIVQRGSPSGVFPTREGLEVGFPSRKGKTLLERQKEVQELIGEQKRRKRL